VQFQVNENGDIDSVAVPIEPAIDNIIFKRKQPQLTPEMVAALLGNYDTPVDGLAFTISASEDKLYLTQTGGAPEEIKAYKLTDEAIGLSLRRTRFDFARESDGTIVHLTIKALGMTLTAIRRAAQA
jgi:hypothetical protein